MNDNDYVCQVVQVTSGQSVPVGSTVVVGSRMLDSVSDSDTECVTSLAPLMDLVSIFEVRSEILRIHFCLMQLFIFW